MRLSPYCALRRQREIAAFIAPAGAGGELDDAPALLGQQLGDGAVENLAVGGGDVQAEGVGAGGQDAAADLEGGGGSKFFAQLAGAIFDRPGGGHDASSGR